MCIIAAKPAGIEMPKDKYIRNMFSNNPDGAGFMYALNGRVFIEKGFMEEWRFMDRLYELEDKYGLVNLPLVMHFRITTHGGTKPENCHPFPVTDSIGMLQKLKATTDIGVAHNGIIDIRVKNKNISDTMEYIASQLSPLKRAVPSFYKNKDLMQMVYNAIDSKMCIMNGKGEMFFVGDFREDEGIKYSNGSYLYSFTYRDYPHSVCGMADYYDDYGQYIHKDVMWLDEAKGEHVRDTEGNICSGDDFAIDKEGFLYYYDCDMDIFIPTDGIAVNAEGNILRFNPKSWVTTEYILVEEYYE